MSRAVDPFREGLAAVFPQIRQFLSRLLDPLESEGIRVPILRTLRGTASREAA